LLNTPSLKSIILLYSEKTRHQSGTKEYAENLQDLLQSRHEERDLRFELIPLSDVSDAKEIQRNLIDRLTRYLQQTGPVHLNYTGGTKAMGIHVYRWLEEYAEEKNLPVSFSYLDARTFQIVDDKNGRITDDLRNEISLSLDKLIKLYGFEMTNEPSDDDFNLFNNAINKFKELIDNDTLEAYFTHYDRTVFTDEKGKLLNKTQKLKSKITEKGFIAQGAFLEVIKLIPEEYRLFNNDGSFKEPTPNKNTEKAIEFLDGKWLELYVYNVLKRNISDKNIALYNNWEIKKPEWQSPNQKFELDVILIKGYQLIGISCTTSGQKHLCKSKGFEIFMRTRQIGGEEARSVLVTRLSESQKEEVQSELEIDTGGRENILVLGASDLKEGILVEKIRDFIK
jgi:hypothetical protein